MVIAYIGYEKTEHINKARDIYSFIETLRDKPEPITEFDENLWITLIKNVEVSHNKKCVVCLKNGNQIKNIEKDTAEAASFYH